VDSSKEGEKHQKSKETWVVTCPLWLPRAIVDGDDSNASVFRYSYNGIGRPPSIIAVPTHFYKVIVVVDVKSSKNDAGNSNTNTNKAMAYSLQQFAAFVLPNTDMIGEKESGGGIRLVEYVVNLTDLEVGLEFFPLLF